MFHRSDLNQGLNAYRLTTCDWQLSTYKTKMKSHVTARWRNLRAFKVGKKGRLPDEKRRQSRSRRCVSREVLGSGIAQNPTPDPYRPPQSHAWGTLCFRRVTVSPLQAVDVTPLAQRGAVNPEELQGLGGKIFDSRKINTINDWSRRPPKRGLGKWLAGYIKSSQSGLIRQY